MKAVKILEQRMEALNAEITALEGESKAAQHKAEQRGDMFPGTAGSGFQIQALALKHKRSGMEESLEIIRAAGTIPDMEDSS